MKRNEWVLLTEEMFGTSLWEESSRLFWCGGECFALVFERNVVNVPRKEIITFLSEKEVKDAWKNEQAEYEYYRCNT